MENSSTFIRETFFKIAQLILESRIILSPQNPSKLNSWFNIELEENEEITLQVEKLIYEHAYSLLVLNIYCQTENSEAFLIEQWKLEYRQQSGHESESQQIYYKKLMILIRSLCIQLRILPAYAIFRRIKSREVSIKLIYQITNSEKAIFGDSELNFQIVQTQYGIFKCSVKYFSQKLLQSLVPMKHSIKPIIIPDYIPQSNSIPISSPSFQQIKSNGSQTSPLNIVSSPSYFPQSPAVNIPSAKDPNAGFSVTPPFRFRDVNVNPPHFGSLEDSHFRVLKKNPSLPPSETPPSSKEEKIVENEVLFTPLVSRINTEDIQIPEIFLSQETGIFSSTSSNDDPSQKNLDQLIENPPILSITEDTRRNIDLTKALSNLTFFQNKFQNI